MTPCTKILLLFSLLLSQHITAQIMWPGDVNNNGIADGADFIYYGLAHGSTGPVRPGGNSNWTPQNIAPWSQTFPNGVNYAFADIDGDGEVENSDQSKFEDNWGKVHGTITPDGYGASSGGAPLRIHLIPSVVQTGPGTPINIEVRLGDAANPLTNVYGFAFKFHYDNNLVESGGSDIEFDEQSGSWIDFDNETRNFFQKNETIGRAEMGITRTNQVPASGQGRVGSFYVIIEDIIVGLTVDTFRISIDSVVLYDSNLQAYAVQGDTAMVRIVAPDYVAASEPGQSNAAFVQITPNPMHRLALIETTEELISWQLLDMQGRVAPANLTTLSQTRYRLQMTDVPAGMYLLHGQTSNGTFQRKVCVLPQ